MMHFGQYAPLPHLQTHTHTTNNKTSNYMLRLMRSIPITLPLLCCRGFVLSWLRFALLPPTPKHTHIQA